MRFIIGFMFFIGIIWLVAAIVDRSNVLPGLKEDYRSKLSTRAINAVWKYYDSLYWKEHPYTYRACRIVRLDTITDKNIQTICGVLDINKVKKIFGYNDSIKFYGYAIKIYLERYTKKEKIAFKRNAFIDKDFQCKCLVDTGAFFMNNKNDWGWD